MAILFQLALSVLPVEILLLTNFIFCNIPKKPFLPLDPPEREVNREVANITERKSKNPCKWCQIICLSVCLSIINFDPNYLGSKFI